MYTKDFWNTVNQKMEGALLALNDVLYAWADDSKMNIAVTTTNYPPKVAIQVQFDSDNNSRASNDHGYVSNLNDAELAEAGAMITKVAEALQNHPVKISKAYTTRDGIVEYWISADYEKIRAMTNVIDG